MTLFYYQVKFFMHISTPDTHDIVLQTFTYFDFKQILYTGVKRTGVIVFYMELIFLYELTKFCHHAPNSPLRLKYVSASM